MKIKGVVEAVGDKFNGSLKVGGKWYNNKKGFENPAKVGDEVTLTLQEWEFKGKTGVNIIGVESAVKTEKKNPEPEKKTPVVERSTESKGRDFDKEAKGKTLCQYIQAQLANPSIDLNDLDGIFARAQELRNRTFDE